MERKLGNFINYAADHKVNIIFDSHELFLHGYQLSFDWPPL